MMDIRQTRKALGFTQEKMAAMMCVNPRTIRRYEAGEVALTKGRAELLRLKIEAVLEQNGEKFNDMDINGRIEDSADA